jgi:SOS-response transcriptional repressor LexA
MDSQYSSCAEAEPFALRVVGDSMEPEFGDGCIIIVDPAGYAQNGSFVIARQGEEHIFRQLLIVEGQMWLHALNPDFPDLPLPGGVDDIKGIVVQQAGRRRRDRRHYV